MVTRPIRVVPYHKELPPINLHDYSQSGSCEVMKQIKCIISPPAEEQWTSN